MQIISGSKKTIDWMKLRISFLLAVRRLYRFEPKITTACVMGRRPVAFQKLNINNAIKSASGGERHGSNTKVDSATRMWT
ncbi:MAG: hypothetical protein DMG15_27360 [Acidobacteria bacterium]|nr:MAG: hypothetical protein DMG16_19545 [Acidobacteriota bacterium]PYS08324.1 MAG: hypothetical protein DMG15_27360 [Acidobacteriota bacterium]